MLHTYHLCSHLVFEPERELYFYCITYYFVEEFVI